MNGILQEEDESATYRDDYLLRETFLARLDSFKGKLVNIEFETHENTGKKVYNALLTNVGADFLELNSPDPQIHFLVLTIIPGWPFHVAEFVKNLVIRDLNRLIALKCHNKN